MISKEYIDKFTKILSYYEISQSDIYDITRAISFAESFGTHPIRLKDLAVSGVDYFANITSDRKDAKPLPDTRLMRVMCDSVTVILFIKKSNIFAKPDVMSVMGMLSNNLSTVLTQANKLMKPDFRGRLNLGKIDHYKTVEECEKVLNVLESTCISEEAWNSLLVFEDYIKELSDFIRKNGFSDYTTDSIREATKSYKVAVETKLLGTRGSSNKPINIIIDEIKLMVTLSYMQQFINSLNISIEDNNVKANLKLAKLVEYLPQQIGIFSTTPNIPSFEFHHFKHAAVYFNDKLEKIFTRDKSITISSIPYLVSSICYFSISSISVDYDNLLKSCIEIYNKYYN